MMSPRLRKI